MMTGTRTIQRVSPTSTSTPVRTGRPSTPQADGLSQLVERLLSDDNAPPAHLIDRAPVVTPLRVVDAPPRVTALPPRRTCVLLSHHDAALLVVALGATLRHAAGSTTALTAPELHLVRQVATLLHRALPQAARTAIRERAVRMAAEAPTPVNGLGVTAGGRGRPRGQQHHPP